MQDPERSETYAEGRPGPLVLGLALGLAVLGAAVLFHLGPAWPLPLALGGLAWLLLGRRRRAIQVDSTGLTELFGLGPPRFHPWSEVDKVDIRWDEGRLYRSGHDAAVITTRQGPIALDSRMPDWLRLARRVQQHCDGDVSPPEDERGDVGEAELAQWLGIEPGAAVECRMSAEAVKRAWRVLAVPGVAVVLCVCAAAYGLGSFPWGPPETWPQPEPWFVPASFILLSVALGVVIEVTKFALRLLRQTTRISVGVDGLVVTGADGRRQLAWHELVLIRRTPPEDGAFFSEEGWIVTHETGEFRIFDWQTHAARLASTVENVILAREAGRRLTVDEPLPAGAISLTRPDQEPSDRGLSQVDG